MSITTPNSDNARTAAEDALWVAVSAEPDTAAVLAKTAAIGASTARKILTRWAADGTVTRVADPDNPRAADRWMITASEGAATAPTEEPAPTAPEPTAVPEPVTASGDPTPTTPEAVPVPETVPEAEPAIEDAPITEATPVAEAVEAESASGPAAGEDPQPVTDGADPTPQGVCPTCGRGGQRGTKTLAPGSLRGLVEDYLRDNPGQEFTPGQIGKALERSSGAVYNALFTLTQNGVAEHTCDKPHRFTLHPDQQQ